MLTKNDILQKTGCTKAQFEHWVDVEFIPHAKRHGRGDKRGVERIYHDKTIQRISIIQSILKTHNSYMEVAFELFLRGYSVGPDILRDALVMHFQRHGQLHQHIRAHTDRKEWTQVKEREALHRYVTRNIVDIRKNTIEAGVPISEMRDVAEVALLWERGIPSVRKRIKKDYGLPSVDDQALAQRVTNADDEQLARARQASNVLLSQRQQAINMLLTQEYSTPQEIVRWFLDGHTCPYHHTYIQALRPLFLAYALQPASDDELDGLLDFYENVDKAFTFTPFWPNMAQSKHYTRP